MSATSGMVQSARLKKGTGGRRRSRRPSHLTLPADAPFRSFASEISISSPYLPHIRFTIPQNASASSGTPIFPLFPLCATHHSARLRAESQSFPLFYPIRFTIPQNALALSGISIITFTPFRETRQRRAGTLVCKTSSMWRKLNGTNSKISDFSCS